MEKFEFNPHEREARDNLRQELPDPFSILIHTSVKLVTLAVSSSMTEPSYFNPHEREARDPRIAAHNKDLRHFNPHEREARDCGELDS